MAGLTQRLTELYESETPRAIRFRYAILIFDLLTLLFIVTTSFLPPTSVTEVLDVVVGAFVLADFAARQSISSQRLRDLVQPASLADIAAILSFLAPIAGEGVGFLRVVRTLRLLHTYRVLQRLRVDSAFFRQNEDVILATTHLGIFIFIMTALVYETQHYSNKAIANYMDALYFTVTALTTTGFGDITLLGPAGKLLSVVIMICGVTLFLRLAQVLFRPPKVNFQCPACGLKRHDTDAVHCKACGVLLNIPDEGAD